ncbi:MAG: tetratricopeptide repeat protein [Myxococcota bacterium]
MRRPGITAPLLRAGVAGACLLVGGATLAAQRSGAGGRRAARTIDRAERFFASGDLGSATSLFRRAVQADPGGSAGYLGLARAYRARGDLAEAQAVLESGARRVPGSVELQRALLDLHLEVGALDRAEAQLDDALRRFPARAELWRLRGELAQRSGRFSEALTAYRTVLDLAARGSAVAREDAEAARTLAPALVVLLGERDPVARCGDRPVREALCARGR